MAQHSPSPNFNHEWRTVFYNHLARHTVSCNDEGTLTDCISWVIVHPDLYSHVEARIAHLPKVKDLINVYCALTKAAPLYSVLVKHNRRTSAPKSEKKKKVVQVASKAYQAVVQAAEKVISMLANPQAMGALSDLMPLCNKAVKWGPTSVEELTPTSSSSSSDSSYSEVESFDLLPELD
ncbi:hypothetical protein ONZ51_g10717 [Trametes cubensis]|uniref:Uncharacterized protein n=1 Tax=Trametes cubensis TaxID=1111947 RepID=A0AAD7TIZ5_9APHY|nr:hypothetical protein ONZ51_g10717 [Trametes cubensis]